MESRYNKGVKDIIIKLRNELINKAALKGESLYNNDVKESYVNKNLSLKIESKA